MLYDRIGKGYQRRRTSDPRIAAAILSALGDAPSVVNVGAGTGSYEPTDRAVVAIEPSMTMIKQRPPGAAPAIRAVAESLPLRDKCAAAGMAVLTVHHWRDVVRGLEELRRVSRERVALVTYDPNGAGFWLTDEYFPAIVAKDRLQFPPIELIASTLGRVEVRPLPVPRDCIDGFLGAFWARPHSYLDPGIRSGISAFTDLPGLDEGLFRLRNDLDTGLWQKRFGNLCSEDQLDIGYRLVVATMQ
jgi:SAM-dependent methyltransferase